MYRKKKKKKNPNFSLVLPLAFRNARKSKYTSPTFSHAYNKYQTERGNNFEFSTLDFN